MTALLLSGGIDSISILMHFHIIFNRENAETDRKASIIFPIIYYCGNNTALSSANRRSRRCNNRILNRLRRLSACLRGRKYRDSRSHRYRRAKNGNCSQGRHPRRRRT